MTETTAERAELVLAKLKNDTNLSKYLASDFPIPQPFIGKQSIKLIVLGQDPTVKDAFARKKIKMVLNLDRKKSVWNYLVKICRGFGLAVDENVYATNLYKNFFVMPPTEIKEIDIFSTFLPYWLPFLKDELAQYPGVPVITLGEPVMQAILKPGVPELLRDYWGYTAKWEIGRFQSPQYLKPENNLLGQTVFPFPHQPGLRKQFYKTQMDGYISFMKATISAK